MRTHYIPQKYLSRFSIEGKSNIVWQYDCQVDTSMTLTVKAVGVFTDWFSPLTETQQSEIEDAALEPMDKLAYLQQDLNEAERKAVCSYIASMIQRIPPGRELALSIMEENYERLKNNPELLYEEIGVPISLAEIFFAQSELDGTRARIIEEDAKLILDLPIFESTLDKMQWKVLLAKGSQRFITSDAPVYWDKASGLGKSGAELTFPISSNAVLYLCNVSSSRNVEFIQCSDRVHTQLNRRAVYYFKRFIFSSTDGNWVKALAHRRIEPAKRLAVIIGR